MSEPTAPARRVLWGAGAYLALARAAGPDPAAVRAAAADAAARERAEGREPVASPFVLWALLAQAAPPAPEDDTPGRRARRAARAAETAAGARDADRRTLARLALAAVAAHAADPTPPPPPLDEDAPTPPPRLVLLHDPDTALARTLVDQPFKDAEAWRGYLQSLAVELAQTATDAAVERLAGPLAHVHERATYVEGEFADEWQDAVVAAYDAASGAWDEDASVAARQHVVAGEVDALERAVLAGRVARAVGLTGGKGERDAATELRDAYPDGLALWREAVRAIVRGDVELAGPSWRRTLWTLQLAFGVGAEYETLRTTDATVLAAAERAGLGALVRRAG